MDDKFLENADELGECVQAIVQQQEVHSQYYYTTTVITTLSYVYYGVYIQYGGYSKILYIVVEYSSILYLSIVV